MFLWEATEEKSSLREMKSCVRQLKVEEEAALREAAPTISTKTWENRNGLGSSLGPDTALREFVLDTSFIAGFKIANRSCRRTLF